MVAIDRISNRLEALAIEAVDHHEFRYDADAVLRRQIGYDVATWAPMDLATLLFTSCDVLVDGARIAHDAGWEQALFALEFTGRDPLTYLSITSGG